MDAGAAALAVLVAWAVRPEALPLEGLLAGLLLLPAAWLGVLNLQRAYETRFLGTGVEEYRRVTRGALLLLVGSTVAAYLSQADLSRALVLVAAPTVLVLTVLGRHLLRGRLFRQRRRGLAMHRLVVVGRADAAGRVIDRLARMPEQGLAVVAACLPGGAGERPSTVGDVPVLGSVDEVLDVVAQADAHAVAVVSHPDLSGQALRRLAWALEEGDVDLVVVPGIVEVAGPRLSIRPIAGLSLLHLQRPATTGARLALKLCFDRVLAFAALVVATPLLGVVVLTLRLHGCRTVLGRSPRVGREGHVFELLTLRAISGTHSHATGMVGRFHLWGLPALVNVLRGDLSLVGPRAVAPASPGGSASEFVVEPHNDAAVSRLLRIRPGLTGPWRLAEREQPTADETLSMELRYVDNWSVTLDVVMLCRTLRALVAGTLPSGRHGRAQRLDQVRGGLDVEVRS